MDAYMVNEPRPNQMTVGKLRALLEDVPAETVVALFLPKGFQGHPDLAIITNVDGAYNGGLIFRLTPQMDRLDTGS
jgi:hypothetical protein